MAQTSGSTERGLMYGDNGTSAAGKLVAEFTLSWSLRSQDIVNNTSTISVSYMMWMTHYSYNRDYCSWQVTTDNHTRDFPQQNVQISVGGLKFLGSFDEVIQHNADGTKSFSLSSTYTEHRYDNGGIWKQVSNAGTFELPAIPQPAVITDAQDFNDEDNPSFWYEYTPVETDLDNQVSLQASILFDDPETTDDPFKLNYRDIPLPNGEERYEFELTDDERLMLQAAVGTIQTAATVYVTLKTTRGGSKVDYSYYPVTLKLVNIAPSLYITMKDTNPTTKALTGNDQTFIRYHSNLYYDTGAQGAKGATIASQYASMDGNNISSKTGTFNNIEQPVLTVMATDSRGISIRAHQEIDNFIEYVKLTCSLDTDLLTADGDLPFTISGKYFSGSFSENNSNTMTVAYCVKDMDGNCVFEGHDGDGFITIPNVYVYTDGDDNYSYSYTIEGLAHDLDSTVQYTLTVKVNDKLTPAIAISKIVQAIPVFDWDSHGFNFNVPVTIEGGSVDTILEQGSYSGWTYRKWASGIAECWTTLQVTASASNTTTVGWYSSGELSSTNLSYPITFSARPTVTVSLMPTGATWAIVFPSNTTSSITRTGTYQFMTTSSTASKTYLLSYNVKGYWK